jgi:hypothetical protein
MKNTIRLSLAILLSASSAASAAPQQPGFTPFGANGDGTFSPQSSGIPLATFVASATYTPTTGVTTEICGEAGKTVRLISEMWSGSASAAGGMTLSGILTSSPSTGGTSTTVTASPYVSGNTPVAVVKTFTVAPTAGTIVGRLEYLGVPFQATSSLNNPIIITHGADGVTQPITLTAGQCVDFSLTGTVPSSPTLNVALVWTEQ